jgi:hypothetical protein
VLSLVTPMRRHSRFIEREFLADRFPDAQGRAFEVAAYLRLAALMVVVVLVRMLAGVRRARDGQASWATIAFCRMPPRHFQPCNAMPMPDE